MDHVRWEPYEDSFEKSAVDALLCGRFREGGPYVRVDLELTSLRIGSLIGRATLRPVVMLP